MTVDTRKPPLWIYLHISKCAGSSVRTIIEHNFSPRACLFLGSREVRRFRGRTRSDMVESLVGADRDRIRIAHGHGAYRGLHECFPDRDAKYVIFFRDPVERVFSNYRYRRRQLEARRQMVRDQQWSQTDFDVWLGSKRDFRDIDDFEKWFHGNDQARNYMTRALLNRDAEALPEVRDDRESPEQLDEDAVRRLKTWLDHAYFVGRVENPQDFLFLYGQLGVRWFTPRQKVSKATDAPLDLAPFRSLVESANTVDRELYEYAKRMNQRFACAHSEYDQTIKRVSRKRRVVGPAYSWAYPFIGRVRESLWGRFKRF